MGPTNVGYAPPKKASLHLKALLHELHDVRCPHVPNPPTCMKRAAVALIIRVRPIHPVEAVFEGEQWGSPEESFTNRLDLFFQQPWVQHGEPEVLFIKRTVRSGDRWTGHIALPGGKKDPGDLDDLHTSRRETREETGLNLDNSYCMLIGKLPERLVTSAWENRPLMVLCPFVYLLMRHEDHPLMLQPTEVSSAHWVPLKALLSSGVRTVERSDVFERMTNQGNQVTHFVLRTIFGRMLFAATQLIPTESHYFISIPDFHPEDSKLGSPIRYVLRQVKIYLAGKTASASTLQHPLLLWGLTLGILADFLGPVYVDGALGLWDWPTFSHWDFRLAIWLFTYSFRARKLREMHEDCRRDNQEQLEADSSGPCEGDINTFSTSAKLPKRLLSTSIVEKLLDGYYSLMKVAVLIVLLWRLSLIVVVILLWERIF